MAKASGHKSGSSKIRFIMLEADLADGNLSEVTQAIQNALRPQQSPVRFISNGSAHTNETIELEAPTFEAADDVEGETPEVARRPRSSRPRAIKPPKVVDGIDWDGEPSLRDFAEEFDLKTDFERYLVIALWFRDHRDTPAVTASHVYTAYRQLGWPTSIPDFNKPFRNMVTNQLFTGGVKDGFAINQLGEGKVKAKKRV